MKRKYLLPSNLFAFFVDGDKYSFRSIIITHKSGKAGKNHSKQQQ